MCLFSRCCCFFFEVFSFLFFWNSFELEIVTENTSHTIFSTSTWHHINVILIVFRDSVSYSFLFLTFFDWLSNTNPTRTPREMMKPKWWSISSVNWILTTTTTKETKTPSAKVRPHRGDCYCCCFNRITDVSKKNSEF